MVNFFLENPMRKRTVFVWVVAVGTAACVDQPARVLAPSTARSEQTAQPRLALGQQWMPVGTKVPVGTDLVAPPEPYSLERDGPAGAPSVAPNVGSSDPGAVAGHHAPSRGQAQAPRSGFPPPPDQADRGWWLMQATQAWYGVYSLHDIGTDISFAGISGTPYLYAPTLLAPGDACIEMTMAHFGYPTTHQLWAWDWCHGPFQYGTQGAYWDLTSSNFQSNYVRTYNGKPTIAVSVVTPNTGHTAGQCWYMDIYNYNLGGYQELFSSCGYSVTGWGSFGWSMWEEHFLTTDTYCPAVASVGAAALSFAHPSTSGWSPITSFPSDYATFSTNKFCWQPGGGYYFQTPVTGAADGSWRALTPRFQ